MQFLSVVGGLFIALVAGVSAQAQSSSANEAAPAESVSVESLKSEKPKDDSQDEADKILTNRRLRAASGSLSKVSVMTSLGYAAGSIERPFDAIRPNLTGANTSGTTLQSLGGGVAVKLRMTKTQSLSAGAGLRMWAPFQTTNTGRTPEERQKFQQNQGKIDFNDPGLSYMVIFRALGAQNYVSVGGTWFTDTGLREIGYTSSVGISHSIAKEVGHSTFGLSSGVSFNFFDKSDPDFARYQTAYSFGVYPFFEYAISDTYQLRTLVGFISEHDRSQGEATTFRRKTVYQSVGLGISITRDIYLYPNIQFLPGELRADKTNIALSTNINIF